MGTDGKTATVHAAIDRRAAPREWTALLGDLVGHWNYFAPAVSLSPTVMYVRFVNANYPTGSSPPKVVLALHGTQEVNAVSICRDGLRPSTGTCGLGA
jgi:hypothetical protein